ncbi:hypothetical protein [Brevibacillus sp. SYSU BS000544]|uniref:hypothetical protein n=1 Tax=Brevibacillus sp. SYSU BS000544 TaxID=3416443 RepID=UPI003CE4590E
MELENYKLDNLEVIRKEIKHIRISSWDDMESPAIGGMKRFIESIYSLNGYKQKIWFHEFTNEEPIKILYKILNGLEEEQLYIMMISFGLPDTYCVEQSIVAKKFNKTEIEIKEIIVEAITKIRNEKTALEPALVFIDDMQRLGKMTTKIVNHKNLISVFNVDELLTKEYRKNLLTQKLNDIENLYISGTDSPEGHSRLIKDIFEPKQISKIKEESELEIQEIISGFFDKVSTKRYLALVLYYGLHNKKRYDSTVIAKVLNIDNFELFIKKSVRQLKHSFYRDQLVNHLEFELTEEEKITMEKDRKLLDQEELIKKLEDSRRVCYLVTYHDCYSGDVNVLISDEKPSLEDITKLTKTLMKRTGFSEDIILNHLITKDEMGKTIDEYGFEEKNTCQNTFITVEEKRIVDWQTESEFTFKENFKNLTHNDI